MANNDKMKMNEDKKSEAEMDDTEARTKTLTEDEQTAALETKKELDEQAIDTESDADA
jgi:hypothetical protein